MSSSSRLHDKPDHEAGEILCFGFLESAHPPLIISLFSHKGVASSPRQPRQQQSPFDKELKKKGRRLLHENN